MKEEEDREGILRDASGCCGTRRISEELPAIFLDPKKWNKTTVVWIDEAGKAGLFSEGAPLRPKPEIQLLARWRRKRGRRRPPVPGRIGARGRAP